MFNRLFRKKNDNRAKSLYASALKNIRNEAFFTKYKIEDSFEGRFDLLLIHIFIILQRYMPFDDYNELSQDLFDVMFKDMEQSLREIGVGDVGIPKHMKRMMVAFNGRMHAYHQAINKDDSFYELKEVVSRNLYGKNLSDDDLDKDALNYICCFIEYNLNNYNDIGDFVMLESNNVRK